MPSSTEQYDRLLIHVSSGCVALKGHSLALGSLGNPPEVFVTHDFSSKVIAPLLDTGTWDLRKLYAGLGQRRFELPESSVLLKAPTVHLEKDRIGQLQWHAEVELANFSWNDRGYGSMF